MYFKAAVLVPFYAISFLCCSLLLFALLRHDLSLSAITGNAELYNIFRISMLSGMVGMSAATIFLNRFPKVAHSLWRSLCSWYLCPVLLMGYLLATDVNLGAINSSSRLDDFATALYLAMILFHLIGLTISFVDFRRSVSAQAIPG